MRERILLYEILIKHGMTLNLLSKKSGVAYATVHGLFTGKKSINDARVDSLKKLADALDMSMDELFQRLRADDGSFAPIPDFDLFWKDEIIASVQFSGNKVNIKRYDLNPGKQIFFADQMPLFVFGQIIQGRCWDPHREDNDRLLSILGIKEYNPYEIVKRTHGLMVQDPIWFRFKGERLSYKEVRRLKIEKY